MLFTWLNAEVRRLMSFSVTLMLGVHKMCRVDTRMVQAGLKFLFCSFLCADVRRALHVPGLHRISVLARFERTNSRNPLMLGALRLFQLR